MSSGNNLHKFVYVSTNINTVKSCKKKTKNQNKQINIGKVC